MIELTPAQRRELRADAHHLHPVATVAGNGLTDAVLEEIDRSLQAHELIKVKVQGAEREARDAYLTTICETLDAAPVQHIGNILVIWRQRRDEETPAKALQKEKTAAGRPAAKAKSARAFAAAARVAAIQQEAAAKKRRSVTPRGRKPGNGK